MKKLLMLVLSLVLVLTLAGCKEDEEEYEFNVPDSFNVNIQELGYSEYISLSNPTVTIQVKDMGDIVIQLFPSVAPNSVNNFIKYIQDGAYEDNLFHRVVNGFMIQAGGLEDLSCNIDGEFDENDFDNPLLHTAGVISMARADAYDSASSQFFIVHRTSTTLDGFYASFGGVVAGFHIIDYIASLNNAEVNEITIAPVYIENITIDLNGYIPSAPICITEEAE